MTPERWERVKAIVQGAVAISVEERAAWVVRECGGDAELIDEAESLLKADSDAGDFIETPALGRHDMAMALDALRGSSMSAGRRVGSYLLVRELGHGGMGVVYLAVRVDDAYRKDVAIKVVRSQFVPELVQQRFRHERQILAALDHPHIARLYDGGSTEDGAPYFVLEYVDGLPIDQYCDSRGLSIDERLALFRHVCGAVHYAHQHLVVHRDIKPSNILVTAEGVPKLLDFGIAKILDADTTQDRTLTAMRVMTLEVASPEQVRGELVTTAADVYALGILLHRLLTGRGPYEADTTAPIELAREICETDVRRPSELAVDAGVRRRLRGDLDTIVLKALQKEPSRRYGSVEQFAQDIASHLGGMPVLARPDTIRYRTAKFVSRHKVGIAASALVAVSLVGGVVATAWEAHVAHQERSRAERRFNDVRRMANSFLFEFHDAIENLPGSTKARELVVRRALEYFDGLAQESGNDPSLQRELAGAYERVGDVQGLPNFANLGDTAGALKSHQTALALRQRLAAAPSDAALQRELATTYGHLSTILKRSRDPAGALANANAGLAIRERLLALNPGGIAERNAIAVGYHDLGGIMADMGNWQAARDAVLLETKAFEALLAVDPANVRAQRNAAIAYKLLGAHLERALDRPGALENYRKAIALDEPRARDNPRDAQAQLDLSFGYASIGYTLSTMADIDGALEHYRRALSLREQAASADAHDANAADAVARAHLSIGQVLRKAGRWREALASFDRALDHAVRRLAGEPQNGSAQTRLANVYGALAGTHAERAAAAPHAMGVADDWRRSRDFGNKALTIWSRPDANGTLSADARTERDSIVGLIAQCDRALGKPSTTTPRD